MTTLYMLTMHERSGHTLRLTLDSKDNRPVPVEAVQIVRSIYHPDKRPGCEVIALGQAKFIRREPPHPKVYANIIRALDAAGFTVYR